MKTNLHAKVAVLAVLTASLSASAQVSVTVGVPLPTVKFAVPPPLVVVSPGVEVVESYHEEVYYTGGWYWLWWNDGWYRSRDHLGSWVIAPRRLVPARIISFPRGKYKNWKRGGHGHGHGHGEHGGHHGHGGGHGGHGKGKKHGGGGKGKH